MSHFSIGSEEYDRLPLKEVEMFLLKIDYDNVLQREKEKRMFGGK